jgi:hypothetical protein
MDLFLCCRFNPRLISSSFQPIFRNRIAALEEAVFSPLSGAGSIFLYDSKFHPHDGRSELNEVASFNAEILHLEMPLTCYIFNNQDASIQIPNKMRTPMSSITNSIL